MGDIDDDTEACYYFHAGVSGYVNLGAKNLDWVEAIESVCIKKKSIVAIGNK